MFGCSRRGERMDCELSLLLIFKNYVKNQIEKMMNDEVESYRLREFRERLLVKKIYRAGYRLRVLDTVVGSIELQVPRLREKMIDFSFFQKWQRRTKTLEKSIYNLMSYGLSHSYTSLVVKNFNKMVVSDHVCKSIKNMSLPEVYDFNNKEIECPDFVILDATWKGRNMCILSALGLYIKDGICEKKLLAFKAYHSESTDTWDDFIYRFLYLRGIRKENGLKAFIADGMKGINQAVKRYSMDTEILGCFFHFQKNIFDYARDKGIMRKEAKVFTDDIKNIFYQKTKNKAWCTFEEIIKKYEHTKYKPLVNFIKKRMLHQLRFYDHKSEYWEYIRTISYIERFFKEIKRKLKHWTYIKSLDDMEKAFWLSFKGYQM